jgi:putative DNA primase/helicase
MTEQPAKQKCRFCNAETLGSDVCHQCLDNPARQEFFEKLKQNKGPAVQEKVYPVYSVFCDDPEEQTGFKPALVAEYLAEHEHFKTDRKNDILYFGDSAKGVWSRDGETVLKEICGKILGRENRVSHYNNILHHLKSITYQDLKFSQKIACENGLLDVETGELTPFTLDEMAFHQIDCVYDKDSECPNFLEFLKQVVNSEDIPTLQEWSGYLLLPDYRFHKLLWIHGLGRNGKGVWQRTMEAVLGEQNVSSIGLEELDGNHRFALERLYGKLFNPCSEPTTNRILQTSLLKKATGQDTIEAEIKGKQKRIKFRNTAKITVLANRFPKVRDESTAFRDRRLFITFPNEFIGKNCIVNLEKVWLEDAVEKSGILNWMLQGLQRLLINNCFSESKSQEETEILFERASDTISAFLKEMAVFGKNYAVLRSYAFDLYKEYCEVFGLDQESDKKFTQRLKETRGITAGKRQGERIWKGVTFKEISEDGEISQNLASFGADRTHSLEDFEKSKNRESINTQKCAPSAPKSAEIGQDSEEAGS